MKNKAIIEDNKTSEPNDENQAKVIQLFRGTQDNVTEQVDNTLNQWH